MPRDQVFISYSHKDKRWLDELLLTLQPLIRKRKLQVWEDSQIGVGKKWRSEIQRALNSAKIAVLLVSRHFLASKFIANNELPPLLEAAGKEGLSIVWIAVGHSLYEETDITEYQAAHKPSQPLNSLSEAQLDEELVRIAKLIDNLANAAATSAMDSVAFESTSKILGNPALERVHRVLEEGKYAWRSLKVLANKAGLPEDATLNLIRADPDIELGKGRKSGNVIAKLRALD